MANLLGLVALIAKHLPEPCTLPRPRCSSPQRRPLTAHRPKGARDQAGLRFRERPGHNLSIRLWAILERAGTATLFALEQQGKGPGAS
jgi:hypothetical protein